MANLAELNWKCVHEEISGSRRFSDLGYVVRRNLLAYDLCLVMDGNRNAVFSQMPVGRIFRPSRDRSGAAVLQARPVAVVSKNKADEGKIQPGRGRQISSMLMAGGVGIGAKDITDGLSGVVFKSWYMIPASCVALAFFSNGGDVNLKPGDTLEVESLQR